MQRTLALFLVAAMCTLSGCAVAGAEASATCVHADAPLASLDLVDDVRATTGGSTACLSTRGVTPVDDDAAPDLPVTVMDAEGREVEITDVSRILPIDISGTIAATVFGLGLGGNVGRTRPLDSVRRNRGSARRHEERAHPECRGDPRNCSHHRAHRHLDRPQRGATATA